MSLQQRDCPGLAPDSLFIRRPEGLSPGDGRNKTVAKVLKKRVPSNRFFDLYQEKTRFPATKSRFTCRKHETAVPLQCHKEQKRFSF